MSCSSNWGLRNSALAEFVSWEVESTKRNTLATISQCVFPTIGVISGLHDVQSRKFRTRFLVTFAKPASGCRNRRPLRMDFRRSSQVFLFFIADWRAKLDWRLAQILRRTFGESASGTKLSALRSSSSTLLVGCRVPYGRRDARKSHT